MASATAYSPTLSVRINDIDYTLSPSGSLDNTTLRRVPVLRIYGDSSTGQKACIHVHNVYPYFYVEYLGGHISPETGKCCLALHGVPH
jgi:DNA polymerase zeta